VRVMSRAKNLTMTKKAILLLEDGSVYAGYSFGAETTTYGEVIFTSSMTGYQEMLADPAQNHGYAIDPDTLKGGQR